MQKHAEGKEGETVGYLDCSAAESAILACLNGADGEDHTVVNASPMEVRQHLWAMNVGWAIGVFSVYVFNQMRRLRTEPARNDRCSPARKLGCSMCVLFDQVRQLRQHLHIMIVGRRKKIESAECVCLQHEQPRPTASSQRLPRLEKAGLSTHHKLYGVLTA